MGTIFSLVLLDAIQQLDRCPRVQDFVAYGRLVTWAQASAGKRDGPSGTKMGHASLTWAFAQAAVLLLRHRQDSCRVSAPADADRFKALLTGAPKVDIVTLEGGGPLGTMADACGASHYHGFYGIDDQAVAATVQWLRANMRR